MRPVHKIGPKSAMKRQSLRKPRISGLGDTSTSESDQEFESPSTANNQTDYGLEFTTSRLPSTPMTRSRSSQASASAPRTPQRRAPTISTKAARTEPPNRRPALTAQPAPRHRRKKRLPNHISFYREYKRLVQRTDFMVPRLPFARLIREIMNNCSNQVTHITPVALEALQTSTEMYITQRLQDSYLLTLHRGRVTLTVKDMQLLQFLKPNGGS